MSEKHEVTHLELIELQSLLRAAYYFLAHEPDEEYANHTAKALVDKALDISLKIQREKASD